MTVNPKPAQPGAFTASSATVCDGTNSVAYSIAAVSGATSYTWSYSGTGATINGTGTSVTVDFAAGATSGSLSVTANNSCGSSAARTIAVTVNPKPAQAGAFTTSSATVCDGSTGVAYSIAAVSGATSYTWSYSGTGATINGTGTSVTVDYAAGATSGNLSVTANNSCGSSTARTIAVTVSAKPAQPGAFTSSTASVCDGTNGVAYSIAAVSGATSYTWSYSGTGATINGTGTSVTVDYAAGATSGNLSVTANNACGSSTARTIAVTVNAKPAQPGAFTSSTASVCAGTSGVAYSVAAVAGATSYTWSYSGTGATFNGSGTSVTVDFAAGATSGTLSVTANNVCGTSTARTIAITVSAPPSTPTITGPTTGCTGSQVQYTATSAGATSFQWYRGATLLAGTGSTLTIASAAAGDAGTYTAKAVNSCGTSASSNAIALTISGAPATPSITGPTTTCAGTQVQYTATAAGATSFEWYRGTTLLAGTGSTLTIASAAAADAGTYTAKAVYSCGTSAASNAITLAVTTVPSAPVVTMTAGTASFCTGGSATLHSSSASGNQWYRDGLAIATNGTSQDYVATTSGSYTVIASNTCGASAASNSVTITVTSTPAAPVITAGSATTFCAGGSVALTSSSASGNQWYLNGSPIGGATAKSFVATAAGAYTVSVTSGSCTSTSSAPVSVTVNPKPAASITAPGSVVAGVSATASVASAGAGATYAWSIANGTLVSGQNTPSITFKATSAGTATINVTVTNTNGCSSNGSVGVTVTTTAPAMTVTGISPATGSLMGGTPVTITGSGFQATATVSIGSVPATAVSFVNGTTLTAVTGAHAPGTVSVAVTVGTTSATLTNGFTYVQQFDPNGDTLINAADVIYLVNFLFAGGAAPHGTAGAIASGDANNDGVVNVSDIFYAINTVFTGGPQPYVVTKPALHATSAWDDRATSLSLGAPRRVGLGQHVIRRG